MAHGFNIGDVFTLIKNQLRLGTASTDPLILQGTADPSAVATDAPESSVYIQKGASPGNVFIKQDSGPSTNWNAVRVSGLVAAAAEAVTVRHSEVGNSDGGTATLSAWTARKINEIQNPNAYTWASISSNQLTLDPGDYMIQGHQCFHGTNKTATRLYDVTNASEVTMGTTCDPNDLQAFHAGVITHDASHITYYFNIAGPGSVDIEFQYYAVNSVGSSDLGLGPPGGGITNSIHAEYSVIKFS